VQLHHTSAPELLSTTSPLCACPPRAAACGAAPERHVCACRFQDDEPPEGVAEAYTKLWEVVRLPAVLRLSVVLVTYRLAFLPAESAAPLKLLEKGVSKVRCQRAAPSVGVGRWPWYLVPLCLMLGCDRAARGMQEALAGLVILQFPCELLSALVAGRWAAAASPFAPWRAAYVIRLGAAAAAVALVATFPESAASFSEHPASFVALAGVGLATSFSSTLMFTALGTFYNRVSDPEMGGAYLTMLNTVSNVGVTLPKIAMFWLMDALSYSACECALLAVLGLIATVFYSGVREQSTGAV
jgi:MFS transporter, PAT family, solute carrier family 33 (acetyl-CoA transportor), member 1